MNVQAPTTGVAVQEATAKAEVVVAKPATTTRGKSDSAVGKSTSKKTKKTATTTSSSSDKKQDASLLSPRRQSLHSPRGVAKRRLSHTNSCSNSTITCSCGSKTCSGMMCSFHESFVVLATPSYSATGHSNNSHSNNSTTQLSAACSEESGGTATTVNNSSTRSSTHPNESLLISDSEEEEEESKDGGATVDTFAAMGVGDYFKNLQIQDDNCHGHHGDQQSCSSITHEGDFMDASSSSCNSNHPSAGCMVEIMVTVHQGDGLSAKDRDASLFEGRPPSSDPYVKVDLLPFGPDALPIIPVGMTKTLFKTLSPAWHDSFQVQLPLQAILLQLENNKGGDRMFNELVQFRLTILDHDICTANDCMGVVKVPIVPLLQVLQTHQLQQLSSPGAPVDDHDNWYQTILDDVTITKWYTVPTSSATNASGRIQCTLQTNLHSDKTERAAPSNTATTTTTKFGWTTTNMIASATTTKHSSPKRHSAPTRLPSSSAHSLEDDEDKEASDQWANFDEDDFPNDDHDDDGFPEPPISSTTFRPVTAAVPSCTPTISKIGNSSSSSSSKPKMRQRTSIKSLPATMMSSSLLDENASVAGKSICSHNERRSDRRSNNHDRRSRSSSKSARNRRKRSTSTKRKKRGKTVDRLHSLLKEQQEPSSSTLISKLSSSSSQLLLTSPKAAAKQRSSAARGRLSKSLQEGPQLRRNGTNGSSTSNVKTGNSSSGQKSRRRSSSVDRSLALKFNSSSKHSECSNHTSGTGISAPAAASVRDNTVCPSKRDSLCTKTTCRRQRSLGSGFRLATSKSDTHSPTQQQQQPLQAQPPVPPPRPVRISRTSRTSSTASSQSVPVVATTTTTTTTTLDVSNHGDLKSSSSARRGSSLRARRKISTNRRRTTVTDQQQDSKVAASAVQEMTSVLDSSVAAATASSSNHRRHTVLGEASAVSGVVDSVLSSPQYHQGYHRRQHHP